MTAAVTETQRALETRMSTLTRLGKVVWPNTLTADIESNIPFLRVNTIPIGSQKLGLADTARFRRDGFFQVDVFEPQGTGTGTASRRASEVSEHFPVGLELFTATDSFKIRIAQVDIEPAQIIGTHYVIPVLIRYTSVTN